MENIQFKRTAKDIKPFNYTNRPVLSQVNTMPIIENLDKKIFQNFPLQPFVYIDDSEQMKETESFTAEYLEKLEGLAKEIRPVQCKNPVDFNEICKNYEKELRELDLEAKNIEIDGKEELRRIKEEIQRIREENSLINAELDEAIEKKRSYDKILKDYQQNIKLFQMTTLIDIKEVDEDKEKFRAVAGKLDKYLEFTLEKEENGDYLYEFLSSNMNNLNDSEIWTGRASFEESNLRAFYTSLAEKL